MATFSYVRKTRATGRDFLLAFPALLVTAALVTRSSAVRVRPSSALSDQVHVAPGLVLAQGSAGVKKNPCEAFRCRGGVCDYNHYLIDAPKGGTEVKWDGRTALAPGTLIRTAHGQFGQVSKWTKSYVELNVFDLASSEFGDRASIRNVDISQVYKQHTFDGVSSIQIVGCFEKAKTGMSKLLPGGGKDNGYALKIKIKTMKKGSAFSDTVTSVEDDFDEEPIHDLVARESEVDTDVDPLTLSFSLQGEKVNPEMSYDTDPRGLVTSLSHGGFNYFDCSLGC